MGVETKWAEEQQNDAGEQRHVHFGLQVANKIRSTANCSFSLLPQYELCRRAGDWYKACSKAMLQGDYSPIDVWVREQATYSAREGFTLEDLFTLLRACRACAIDTERWNDDVFSPVDEVINEVFGRLLGKVDWEIPAEINYLIPDSSVPKPSVAHTSVEGSSKRSNRLPEGRRLFGRCRLRLPIRVRGRHAAHREEITETDSVSRAGLYFTTTEAYKAGLELLVVYPYWTTDGALNREYAARVVRIDSLGNGASGVAIRFLEALGSRHSKPDWL